MNKLDNTLLVCKNDVTNIRTDNEIWHQINGNATLFYLMATLKAESISLYALRFDTTEFPIKKAVRPNFKKNTNALKFVVARSALFTRKLR